jgi:hypothetical protein
LVEIAAHLGFAAGAYTTRQMRPLLSTLVQIGALQYSWRRSSEHWALAAAGRDRLARASRR